MKKKAARIYLDNAAATPVDRRVVRAMLPYFIREFGNPGAIHEEGVAAAEIVKRSRERIAEILRVTPDAIIFTGSGTEANNLGLVGLIEALHDRGRSYRDMEIITAATEHPSVLEPARHVKKRGVRVIEVDVGRDGRVELHTIAKHLSKRTVLVSIAYVNSEIGVVAPLREIAKIIRRHRKHRKTALPYFHTDACQAALYFPLGLPRLGVDLMTIDAQKIHGPKGVGALVARRGTPLTPLIRGGGQERKLRSGTENVPGIVGFAEALSIAEKERERMAKKVSNTRDRGIALLLKKLPGSFLNGSVEFRAPNNINITVPGLDGELMVLSLDAAGIAASTKSACERENGPSHVLRALGLRERDAALSLRLSLGKNTNNEDIARAARVIAELRARQMSVASALSNGMMDIP